MPEDLAPRLIRALLLLATVGLVLGWSTAEVRCGEPEPFAEGRDHAADRERALYDARFGDRDPAEVFRLLREARAFKSAMSTSRAVAQQSVPGNKWVELGPRPIQFPRGNVSGRIRSIARTPSGKLYIGSAGGGVWRSVDGGSHWTPLTDFEASLSMGSVAIDPQDSTIIYAGTGEYGTRVDRVLGAGVLRSYDSGAHWTLLGDSPSIFGGHRISKLLLHPYAVVVPASERIVYVASTNGFWRSGDSGQSWTRLINGNFSDAVFDADDPSVVYAARFQTGVYRYVDGQPPPLAPMVDLAGILPNSRIGRINLAMTHDVGLAHSVLYVSMEDYYVGGQFKGIWKTANDGSTWTRVTGIPFGFSNGQTVNPDVLESESAGQSGGNDSFGTANVVDVGDTIQGSIGTSGDRDVFRFSITGGNSATLEILADRAGTGLEPKITLYESDGTLVNLSPLSLRKPDNSPSKDTRLGATGSLAPGTYYARVEGTGGTTGTYQLSLIGLALGCQCGYDQTIAVEPGNSNIMYAGLVPLFRSTDGGANWKMIHDQAGSNWVHADIHTVVIDPAHPNTIYVGSDGGIWKSPDRGNTWQSLNGDLGITQPFKICQHPTRDDFLLIGNQDNATTRYDAGTWSWVGNGDGGFCAIVDNQEWYFTQQYLNVRKTTDGGLTSPSVLTGLGTSDAFFIAPLVLDPSDSQTLIAGGGERPKKQVYRTVNGAGRWDPISQDLGSRISALIIAENNTSVYYTGLQNGEVWRTTNGGATDWTDQTTATLPGETISDIAVANDDWTRVYVTTLGIGNGHVFRSTNGGGVWVDISRAPHSSQPLPDAPVNAIVIDPDYPSTLYVGSDVGLFRTVDAGVHWEVFDHGLPEVAVMDLELNPDAGVDGVFRAATHGRGVWELTIGNDTCANATVIGDGVVSGSTRGATTDGGASCGSSQSSPDVWFRYTATCDGEVRVNTCGSDFDTVVSLHGATCPGTAANQATCNDDCGDGTCTGRASCASAPVTLNDSVLIRVAGFGGASGAFDLEVSCVVPHDQCEDAIPLTVGSTYQGGTRSANLDYAPQCGDVVDTAPGVWHTVIGTGNVMTASLCGAGTSFDSQLSVYCSGCVGSVCLGSNDDICGTRSEVSFCAAPGRVHHILVHGFGASTGTYELNVTDTGEFCGPLYLNCSPANQTCQAAEQVSSFTIGENLDADTSSTATCAVSNSDVWFRREAICNGFWTIDTCGGGTLADTVLSVYDGCSEDELDCNDDADGCGLRSRVTTPALAGTTLDIRVADYGSPADQGTFELNLDTAIAPLEVPWPDLYVGGGGGPLLNHLLRFDPVDLELADVGPFNLPGVLGMAYAPGLGLMYAVQNSIDEDRILTVDLETGAALPFADLTYSAVQALAFDPGALTLYATDNSTAQLLEIDAQTGAERTIGPLGYTGVRGLAIDPSTGVLYGADVASDQLIRINKSVGVGTPVGPFGGGFDQIEGLAFDTVHGVLYGAQWDAGDSGRLVVIDTATGAATQVGGSYANLRPTALAYVQGLPEATVGRPYDEMVPVSGGCPRYYFGGETGLPAGLSLDGGGRLAGVPAESGLFTVDFDVDDSDLGTPAVRRSLPLRVRPGNDDCSLAAEVGDGYTPFSSVYATTDGPDEPAVCNFFGVTQVEADVWFCYEASCTGMLYVDVCDADFDTKVALYDGCACPTGPAAVACNDDSCSVQSQLTHAVTAGSRYGIRVGGYRGASGSGGLTLSCEGEPGGACCLEDSCAVKTAEECAALGGTHLGVGTPCAPDADGDSAIDACDGCPGDPLKTSPGICGCGSPDADLDFDGEPDCVDEDLDGDGWLNGVDCDSADPNTHPEAAEVNDRLDNQCAADPGHGLVDEISGVSGFRDPGDPTRYSWDPQLGASLYDVARAPTPWFAEGCVITPVAVPGWSDPQVPELGATFFYLVRAAAPSPGSWGADSAGAERLGICP